jgi:hypothetical protein
MPTIPIHIIGILFKDPGLHFSKKYMYNDLMCVQEITLPSSMTRTAKLKVTNTTHYLSCCPSKSDFFLRKDVARVIEVVRGVNCA